MPCGYLCPMGKTRHERRTGERTVLISIVVSCIYEIKQRKKEGGKNGREHV